MKTSCTAILLVSVLLAATAFAGSSTATGISRQMNPAVSLNALFWAQANDDDHATDENFVDVQEVELQFSAVVDPFWTADVVVGFAPEGDHGYEADVEIASLRSTSMPSGLGLTLGKMYLPFGKHAQLHVHQYPFTRAPVGQTAFLGEHGLTEVGAAVDATVPLPWWSELHVYGVDGDAEIFDPEDRALAWGARWTNLWDVSEGGTLELGGSWLAGPGALHEDEAGDLNVAGLDLTWKWASTTRSHGPAAQLSAELIAPDPEHGEGDPLGWFVIGQARIHRNWWLGVGYGRADDACLDEEEHDHKADEGPVDLREWKAALTFAPSEFSALRAEVSKVEEVDGGTSDLRFAVQWNFTIGSHPAHLY